ncbi:hypothetical protein L1I79_10090 [Strepomyces sp. STD 3.1]|nr:hypothetical protein [Streptomyces sp. STD 3.1]
MANNSNPRDKARTIVMILMAAVILAFLAGMLGHMFQRDPVEWGAWTFTTVSTLGVVIMFGLWAGMP